MTSKLSQSSTPYDDIRALIDKADKDIYRILALRMSYMRELASLKKNNKVDGLAFKPGREAQLIRKITALGEINPITLTHIWRQIIAASLALQQKNIFGLFASNLDQKAFALASAKSWVGAQNELKIYQKSGEFFNDLKNNPLMIGLVACDDDDLDWGDMAKTCHIVARWPYVKNDTSLPLYILANIKAEPSGEDISVYYQGQKGSKGQDLTFKTWLSPQKR